MREPVFSEYRRDLFAKTAADMLKILFAAALASKLFVEFPGNLKFLLLILGVVLGIIALFACPLRKP